MRRRAFLMLLGAVAAPPAARAQQKAMPVIGYLGLNTPGFNATYLAAFREGLGETGYVEGQNLKIDYRWAEGQYDRLSALAGELVARNVDLIVANGGSPAARAAKDAKIGRASCRERV